MPMTYVLYHRNCYDGFCAAWIARRSLPDAKFVAVQYNEGFPRIEQGATIYILDFSYKSDVLCDLAARSQKVIVLDHHKTAEQELESLIGKISNLVIQFDMDKSGGRLAWEHFYPSDTAHWLVDYTEDRDLWRHRLPHTREVIAYIHSWPFSFELWDTLFCVSRPSQEWINEGGAILRREQQIIDNHVAQANEIEIGGHKVLAVNATVLFSDIAGKLAEDRPFGACYFDRAGGKRQWSLRSRDGGIDVSIIAKAYGGGGHKNAAGFEENIKRDKLQSVA